MHRFIGLALVATLSLAPAACGECASGAVAGDAGLLRKISPASNMSQ
jgi:hypothetical protein